MQQVLSAVVGGADSNIEPGICRKSPKIFSKGFRTHGGLSSFTHENPPGQKSLCGTETQKSFKQEDQK
jgi:hypothetical protein